MAHRRRMKCVAWMLGLGALGVAVALVAVSADTAHPWTWLWPDPDRLEATVPGIEVVWHGKASRGSVIDPGMPLGPPIDTTIKQVDAREGLVLLAAGRDQQVGLGREFTVYRGGTFIGKVKVIKVFPDLAGARVLFTRDGEQIRPGDKASTTL